MSKHNNYSYRTLNRIVTKYDTILDLRKWNITDDRIDHILSQITEPINYEYVNELRNNPWWIGIHSDFQKFLNKKFPRTYLVPLFNPLSALDLMSVDTVQIPCAEYTVTPTDEEFKAQIKKLTNAGLKPYVYAGYALDYDSLWKYHKWIVSDQGVIIETKSPKLVYIGYNNTLAHG